jgi:redox-sensitive bicupin YhaK (pirin superfamily)
VWIFPKEKNIQPRYEQKTFNPNNRQNKILTVVAPDDDKAVWINQNAWFSLGKFEKNFETTYTVKRKDNGVYAFVLEGEVNINGQTLGKRDALGVWNTNEISIKANSNAEILLIDVPIEIEGEV